jgi:3'(2'), 5'-bisphosphate nucleotidase
MQKLLHTAIIAAINAGNEILQIYNTPFNVNYKSDNTPVTNADKAASKLIIETLNTTNIPVISEEEDVPGYEIRKKWKSLWMVDPLDGTKEFVKRNGEFTVNIALIENQKPVIGVIYSPVFKHLYFAANLLGSFKINAHHVIDLINNNLINNFDEIKAKAKTIITNTQTNDFTIIASRSHLSADLNIYIKKLENIKGPIKLINVGSSIKMCWVAEGIANEYPRYGTTMEWDTAAGHCILNNAGGTIINIENNFPLIYNKQNLKNPNFIAKQN